MSVQTQFSNEKPPSTAEGPGSQPRATRRPPRTPAGHWASSQPAPKINKSLLFSSPGISADSHSPLNSHGRLRKEEKCADFSLSRDGPKCRADQSGQGGGNSTKVGKKCGSRSLRAVQRVLLAKQSALPPALAPPRSRCGPAPGGAHTWAGGDFHVWAKAAR